MSLRETNAEIDAVAAEWAVRLDGGCLDVAEQAELDAWLAQDSRRLHSPYLAPQSEMERVVATVWREVLGVETVGVQDNFFEIGGHSLLMLKVQRTLGERIGREPSLVELFTYPDVASLSRFLADDPKTTVQPLDQARQRADRQLSAREQRHRRQ